MTVRHCHSNIIHLFEFNIQKFMIHVSYKTDSYLTRHHILYSNFEVQILNVIKVLSNF